MLLRKIKGLGVAAQHGNLGWLILYKSLRISLYSKGMYVADRHDVTSGGLANMVVVGAKSTVSYWQLRLQLPGCNADHSNARLSADSARPIFQTATKTDGKPNGVGKLRICRSQAFFVDAHHQLTNGLREAVEEPWHIRQHVRSWDSGVKSL